MKKYTIKNTFSDALYWATSTQTKDNEYHITRTEEAILRKLIHYSKSNEKITYSNKIIAQHAFIGEETIRKTIPELNKKGYLSIALIKIFDNGEHKTRRTIFIKWDFIQKILDEVPKQEEPEESTVDINISIDEPIKEVIDAPIIDEQVTMNQDTDLNKLIPDSAQIILNTYPIPDLVLTDEKVNWLKEKIKNPDLNKELLETLSQKELEEIFYGNDGVWRIKDSAMENQFRMKFVHRGGSKCSLYDNSKKDDRIEVNLKDFGYYLGQKGILFDKFTPKQFRDIKTYGMIKKPKNYEKDCFII